MPNILSPLVLTALAAGLLGAGCSGEPQESAETTVPQGAEEEQADTPAVAPSDLDELTIPVTGELGNFESAVSGLAMWTHPTLSYQSGILAANGPAGLIFVDVEKNTPDIAEGNFTGGVAVAYPEWDQQAPSLIAAYDAGQAYRFFDITKEEREFTEWTVEVSPDLPADPIDLCLAESPDGSMVTMAVISENGSVTVSSISHISADTIALESIGMVNVPDALGCVGDDSTSRLFMLTRSASIYAIETGSETTALEARKFADLPSGPVKGIAASLQTGQGQLIVGTVDENTLFYGIDLSDGAILAPFSISSLDEIDGVSELNGFAAAGGNFGTIYRKGIIATIGSGETRTLKLAPLSAALRHWGRFDAPVLNRRDIGQQADDDASDLDLEITIPEIED